MFPKVGDWVWVCEVTPYRRERVRLGVVMAVRPGVVHTFYKTEATPVMIELHDPALLDIVPAPEPLPAWYADACERLGVRCVTGTADVREDS